MANKQIKDYSEETTMVAGDWFLVQKGTTNVTNKVSASNILPAGSIDTADLANDSVTDEKRPRMKFADVYHSTTQSIATATWTSASLNTETLDPEGWHSTVTNTSRITVAEAGLYAISGGFRIPSVADGNLVGAILAVNGTQLNGTGSSFSSATGSEYLNVHTYRVLAANDYVEMQAYQASGASANIADARLTVVKLSD